MHFKQKFFTLCIISSMMLNFKPVYASEINTSTIIDPPEATLINGKEEKSSSHNIIQPYDVILGPYFYSYSIKNKQHIFKFKKIATMTYTNRTNTKQSHTFILNNSSEKGSEWNGNIEFNGKVQTGIISQMQVKLGFELKKTRKENEAKGYQAVANVSPKTVSTTNIYYGGYKSSGKLKTYTTYTATPNKRVYKTTDVNVTLYQSKILDIHTYTSEKSI